MPEGNKDWYSNKELFESIGDLKEEIMETRHLISRYNDLYHQTKENNNDIKIVKEEVKKVHIEVNKIKHEATGKIKLFNMVTQLSGWFVAIIGFFLTYFVSS